ncbi:MAG: helix-turn-helix domain-containing protein [Candidatus Latescibacteria bacterium]|nr:helix-turn-helix domain-containing protein [Candidatus Latescibacterota bacterium]
MDKAKRHELEAKGWSVGTVEEFLQLTPEESAYIELKLKLADGLTQRRKEQGLPQIQLAKRIHSSQSRVAKMEAGDPSVSIDLLVKSLLALGSSPTDLAHLISEKKRSKRV